MDHNDALRLKITEKYLLNELEPDQLNQFEEHMFDCPECAIDVRAAAMFVEQSKAVLSEVQGPVPVNVQAAPRKGWLDWLRPAFAAPALALLLVVVGFQNLVVLPRLTHMADRPQFLPSVAINIATRGSASHIVRSKPGQPFVLLVDLPSESRFSSYIADLYDAAGNIEWSVSIPAEAANDTVSLRVPGKREAGIHTLLVRGIPRNASSPSEIGQQSFELQLQ